MGERKNFHARLRPFAELVYAASGLVQEMDAPELRKLVSATDRLTPTNCSWAAYEIGPLVRKLATERLHRLKHEAKAGAGTTEGGTDNE